MTKESLIELLEKEGNPSKDKILGWVKVLPSSTSNLGIPLEYKKGDVFRHPVFNHPCLILKKLKTGYLCTLLTSSEDCKSILEPCQSRFFLTSYITKILFIESIPQGYVIPYDNHKHVREIYKKLVIELL